jgi:hypothetical protein
LPAPQGAGDFDVILGDPHQLADRALPIDARDLGYDRGLVARAALRVDPALDVQA